MRFAALRERRFKSTVHVVELAEVGAEGSPVDLARSDPLLQGAGLGMGVEVAGLVFESLHDGALPVSHHSSFDRVVARSRSSEEQGRRAGRSQPREPFGEEEESRPMRPTFLNQLCDFFSIIENPSSGEIRSQSIDPTGTPHRVSRL
jgi:hypothetical protein